MGQAKALSRKADRPNLFIKIPGTNEGIPAIEEAIFSGVPINVALLFSHQQYLAAAEAYMRGLERRVTAGKSLDVRSVASLFISRWDKATMDKVPDVLRNKLGIAIGQQTYLAYRNVLLSDRWQRLANLGARGQRLLFASTGTKDPRVSDVLYIDSLAAPNTVNTMPEATLKAFSEHGRFPQTILHDCGGCEDVLDAFGKAGIDLRRLASDLQTEGIRLFEESWKDLLSAIQAKRKLFERRAASACP